jgi:hypothetical protein
MKKKSHSDHDGLAVIKQLIDCAAINHPAVIIPREKTLPALLRANPPHEFLRRLKAFSN